MATIDRHVLHFAEVVEENFNFLAAHDFERTRRELTLVRFESKCVYVNVYHGRKSFELGLEVGQAALGLPNGTPYTMSEIVRLAEPAKADEYRNYAARDAAGVRAGVQQLAALFRRYFDAGVLDDSGVFVRFKRQREAWAQDFAQEVNLRQVRRKLDVVWHAKKYSEVVELLEPLRATLTPTELKKLEYAKKEIAES